MDITEREQRVNAIAKEALRQILVGVGANVYLSWGVEKATGAVYNNMPTLALKVNGLLHTGWVYVTLDEGKDLYEVILLDNKKKVVKRVTDVYCDMLGDFIDEMIERGGMTREEYGDRVAEEFARM